MRYQPELDFVCAFMTDCKHVTGFDEEHPVLLNTNHVGVAKFSSASDPSYCLIRDALAGAVNEIEEECRFYTLRFSQQSH